jgi:hypothetical protein
MSRVVIPRELEERLVKNMTIITILAFIKENENEKIGLSKDSVAKAMNEKGVCSRPTTLKIIDSLLQAGILSDKGRGARNSSDIVVSKGYDFEGLMRQSFEHHIHEIQKSIKPFESLIDKAILKYKVHKDTNEKTQDLLNVD